MLDWNFSLVLHATSSLLGFQIGIVVEGFYLYAVEKHCGEWRALQILLKKFIYHFILTFDVISWKDEIHFVFVLIEDVNVCFSFIMKVSIIKVLTLSLPYERVKEPGLLRP